MSFCDKPGAEVRSLCCDSFQGSPEDVNGKEEYWESSGVGGQEKGHRVIDLHLWKVVENQV